MRKLVFTLFAATLLACGGSEQEDTGAMPEDTQGGMQEEEMQGGMQEEMGGAAGGEEAGSAGMAGAEAGTAAPAAPDPAIQEAGCLSMVAAGNFQQALPICLAALAANPDSAELQAAVEQARAGAAGMAAGAEGAMGEAAAGAEGAAGEAAAGAADDAAAALGQ